MNKKNHAVKRNPLSNLSPRGIARSCWDIGYRHIQGV